MSTDKFHVVITSEWHQTQYGVRQPGCTNRDLIFCRLSRHRWCRNAKTLKSAYGTARIFATYSGLNPQIGLTK